MGASQPEPTPEHYDAARAVALEALGWRFGDMASGMLHYDPRYERLTSEIARALAKEGERSDVIPCARCGATMLCLNCSGEEGQIVHRNTLDAAVGLQENAVRIAAEQRKRAEQAEAERDRMIGLANENAKDHHRATTERDAAWTALRETDDALCDGLLGGAPEWCRLSTGYAESVLKKIRAALGKGAK